MLVIFLPALLFESAAFGIDMVRARARARARVRVRVS